jgi:hypothetical protein
MNSNWMITIKITTYSGYYCNKLKWLTMSYRQVFILVWPEICLFWVFSYRWKNIQMEFPVFFWNAIDKNKHKKQTFFWFKYILSFFVESPFSHIVLVRVHGLVTFFMWWYFLVFLVFFGTFWYFLYFLVFFGIFWYFFGTFWYFLVLIVLKFISLITP